MLSPAFEDIFYYGSKRSKFFPLLIIDLSLTVSDSLISLISFVLFWSYFEFQAKMRPTDRKNNI